MTLTTFNGVRSTRKPATDKKASKPAAAPEKAAEPKRKGVIMVVIAGEGTMPLIDNNGRRVMRGEPVEVSKEEFAWLKSSNSEFKLV